MKKSKKLIVSLAAVALATVPVITTSLNQAHAAQTTDQTQNKSTADDTLTLNHNTRIYNKKGQKLYSYQRSNGLLKKGATVSYVDKPQTIADPDTVRYSFHDDDWNWFYLPYKTIKGQEYYSIGHGGYVKAANVDKIDGNSLYTNKTTATICSSLPYLYDEYGKQLNKHLKAGQKVILDRQADIVGFTEMKDYGNGGDILYRIKDENEFVSFRNVKVDARQALQSFSDYTQVATITNTKLYDKTGESKSSSHVYKKGITFAVSRAINMIDPDTGKNTLFYLLSDSTNLVIRASDVKYISGPKLNSLKIG